MTKIEKRYLCHVERMNSSSKLTSWIIQNHCDRISQKGRPRSTYQMPFFNNLILKIWWQYCLRYFFTGSGIFKYIILSMSARHINHDSRVYAELPPIRFTIILSLSNGSAFCFSIIPIGISSRTVSNKSTHFERI